MSLACRYCGVEVSTTGAQMVVMPEPNATSNQIGEADANKMHRVGPGNTFVALCKIIECTQWHKIPDEGAARPFTEGISGSLTESRVPTTVDNAQCVPTIEHRLHKSNEGSSENDAAFTVVNVFAFVVRAWVVFV